MKVAELLEARRRNWQELDQLCGRLHTSRAESLGPATLTRFAALYRAACADLALADSYQLPPETVQYLHRLVGRAHNQLYRTRKFDYQSWGKILLYDVPQFIFRDRCVQMAFCLFWGIFFASAVLAASPTIWPDFDRQMLGDEMIDQLEEMYKDPIAGRDPFTNNQMVAFYVYNNAGIGLKCFAFGLGVLPGLLVTSFNAAHLGAAFGHMARPEVYPHQGKHFFHFVTAHGPFELTAIVLSAGAGLRMGFSWMITYGFTRGSSLRRAGKDALPIALAAVLLFMFAALLEGLLSPSAAPYVVKALAAALSSAILIFYFIVLGFPRSSPLFLSSSSSERN